MLTRGKGRTSGAGRGATGDASLMPLIFKLPDSLLVRLCADSTLTSADLAAVEAVATRFSRASGQLQNAGGAASIPECAAEMQVRAHRESWRLEKRSNESWKHVLWMLENSSLAPVPVAAAANEHTLVRTADARVFAFGHNNWKQLGLGDCDQIVQYHPDIGHDMSEFTAELGYPRGGQNQGPPWRQHIDDTPREVERLRGCKVASVVAGTQHSAALTDEGALYTWGAATGGRLGHGSTPSVYSSVVAAPRLVTIASLPFGGVRVALVVAGDSHTACITATGQVFTWGDGKDGVLGHGNEEFQHVPTRVEALTDHRVIHVDCNTGVTAAVTSAGALFAWGSEWKFSSAR